MRRIKIFKGIENEIEALESEINGWLESSGVELISTTGNIAPQTTVESTQETFASSDVLIILTYEAPHG